MKFETSKTVDYNIASKNNPSKERSIISLKVDPYPFTTMDDVSAVESVDYVTNEIRKISGVRKFNILKKS